MKAEPKWLAKKALLLLHEESITFFGGGAGLRDEGLLDSALARPVNQFLYRPESTLAELAAAYGYGLARNHAFVDGNKRVAFLAMGLFLRCNGYRLVAKQVDAIRVVMSLAAGEVTEQDLAVWITQNATVA